MAISSRGQASLEQSKGRIKPAALFGSICSMTVEEDKQQPRDEEHCPAKKEKM